MTDLRTTIIPKSDQLNADDLIGGRTLTIKVTKVSLAAGDQPVVIHYEGDNGHPYKPGKSMRRVLVHVWGPDGNAYIGRSMVLYCDSEVQFGGTKVGGIRISHMSHISAPVTMALTATRASRKPFTVKPLVVQESSPKLTTPQQQKDLWARAQAAGVTAEEFMAQFGSLKAMAADKAPAVEVWLTERESITATAPATCEACNGLLIEGRCHNPECANGDPPEVQESLI